MDVARKGYGNNDVDMGAGGTIGNWKFEIGKWMMALSVVVEQ